jgi:very-short-patch-repair endonuclease
LIVEADGSQHAESPADAERDAWLQGQGFAVLRFWNNDVLARSDMVADAIWQALQSSSPLPAASRLSLSRKGRGA